MKQKASNKCKNITLIFSIFIAMLFYVGISYSNANSDVVESGIQEFTIKKVDEKGNPLKDVQFSIKAAPKIEVNDYYYIDVKDYYYHGDKEKEEEEKRKMLELKLEDDVYKLKNPIQLKNIEYSHLKYKVDLTKEICDCTLNIKGQINTKNLNSNGDYVEIKINDQIQELDITSNNVELESKLTVGKNYTVDISLCSKNGQENEFSFTINEISLKFDEKIYTTNEKGEIKEEFRDGSNLKIEEVKPLDGYYKSKGYEFDGGYYTFDNKFSVNEYHENEITVVNKKYRDLIINKVDEEGNSVSDVTFTIDGIMGDPKFDLDSYYYNDNSKISRLDYENVLELDNPITLRAEYEKEKENNVFNYFCEYDIDLTDEKMDYFLTINGILNNYKNNCGSYAIIKLDDKEMQRIDKNSSNVNFQTKLSIGKKYKLGIYFYADNCNDCFLLTKKQSGEIIGDDYTGNTVTINSIMLKPDNLYKTDKDGKIKIKVINGNEIKLKEIETPYGYIKADGYFVGDEYYEFDKPYVVDTDANQIDIKVVNDRIKRKVIVNHYLKGTDKKVAESEEIEIPILEEYTTNGHSDLPGLTFEKNEAGEDVFPSNANGVVEDKDYDTPIVVDYYYEPQDIEITIHHYKEGTNEKLAEDEVLNFPVNLVPDENGIYRAENPTVKYVLESNENYKDLIKKYNLTDITSTIDPDLTIKDYLESGKSFEISYYYNDKKLKDDDNKANNKVDNNKTNNKADNKEKDNDIGKNEETDGDLSLPNIVVNKINEIFEGIKTGDNLFIYIILVLISIAVILKLKMNKNKKKNRKNSK